MSQKIFHNDLVAIRKSKDILTLNKPVYDGMYTLVPSSIVIIFKLNMLITQNCYPLILVVICMKLKPNIFMKILGRIKKHLILVIIQQS